LNPETSGNLWPRVATQKNKSEEDFLKSSIVNNLRFLPNFELKIK